MDQQNYAQRFTDIEYLSKYEINNVLGPAYVESAWRLTTDYREKYRFPVILKRFDNFPFTIVLTPSIMAHANSVELKMFEYARMFEDYRNRENVSENKPLEKHKEEIIKKDLLVLARYAGQEISERDIDLMLEDNSLHLRDTYIYGYYEAVKYLTSSAKDNTISRNMIRDIYNNISRINESVISYRNSETHSGSALEIDPQNIQGAPASRIVEFMDKLYEFYDSDYELSPFIIGSIVYTYICYIIPFERHNDYVASLLLQKVLAEKGYGEACFYSIIPQIFVKKEAKLKVAYENSRTSGDLTYMIVFICDAIYEALEAVIKALKEKPLPLPAREDVKVVEKIVEVPVVKEVIKEVIKEVPVEKIVEKEVIKQEETEEVHEYQKPIHREYDFINDPFENAPAAPVKKVVEEVKPFVQKVEAKPIEEIKEAEIIENNMLDDVKNLVNLEPQEMARGMVEINPLIKYHQALFYANHHDFGRYYTIGQFKKFNDCAYETARTSMELLVSLGLYRKEQLKNKFVYTPNKIED